MSLLPPDIGDSELLSYLRPLYPNGIFPLALGWRIVIGIGIAVALAWFLYHNRPQARRRRKAFAVLDGLRKDFAEQADISALSAGVSILLRRVALVRFGRDKTADLSGKAWTSFLEETGAELGDEDRMLLENQAYAPSYRDEETERQGTHILNVARQWMEQNL